MLRRVLAIALSGVLLAGCARHRGIARPNTRAVKRLYAQHAQKAALEWLELIDNGEYEDAFGRETARLRAAGTARQFARSMRSRRAPFGHAISRKLIGTGYSRRLTGAPDANYESLLFKTSFEHKSLAAERVILVDDHGTWRVVDYRVY